MPLKHDWLKWNTAHTEMDCGSVDQSRSCKWKTQIPWYGFTEFTDFIPCCIWDLTEQNVLPAFFTLLAGLYGKMSRLSTNIRDFLHLKNFV